MTSIFWYDYETTGINPRCDRAVQVAGIRTDADLNEIDQPLNLYCHPADDILPHPMACLITGINPGRLEDRGLGEAEFMTRTHAQLAQPGTCGAGYNSLRFDDEVTRYSLYRNFFDPYAREWQGGNTRWDLIDVVRAAYALRPEGIVWPEEEGRVTLKLERLTAANGIDHGQAHDALSDVRATIALARLIRDKQPKLYEWLFNLRTKQRVLDQVRLLQPMVHISGRFSAARHYLGVVLPLAWHPKNRNALIVYDLHYDPQPLMDMDAGALRQLLYTRREDLPAGQLPIGLKLIHVNRCPVVAPMNVVRAQDQARLQLDMPQYQVHAARLIDAAQVWQDKLSTIYASEDFTPSEDPEQQLYDGFLGERDRQLCERVRLSDPEQLGKDEWPFDDPRLPELLFRYRARNFPNTLSVPEQQRWQVFCQERLSDPAKGAPLTLDGFMMAAQELSRSATPAQLKLLDEWQRYAVRLSRRLGLALQGQDHG